MTTVKRPNILLICTDQQRYDSLGCYGNQHAQTPTLDQLAADGVLFEQCYVQNPVCAPSRGSLVTGRYVHSNGLWANGVSLPQHETLFTKTLADAGYDCGLIGKMHLASCFEGRTEPRFEDGFRYHQWSHDPPHGSPQNQYQHWLAEHHPALSAQAKAGKLRYDHLPTEAHYSHWVAEMAIDFLRNERAAEKPFFLWANFYDPHNPFGAPQEYLARFQPDEMPPPILEGDTDPAKPPIHDVARHPGDATHPRGYNAYDATQIQTIRAAYAAMVALIDDETKRVLDTLDELVLSENTLVVFTSDHGEMLGDHHMLLKGPMMYEGAVHVPLILRWPGHLPMGERRSQLVQWIDLSPTFLEAAGLSPQPRIQGQSLLPLARGDTDAPVRGWALCEYRNSGRPYDPPVHATMLRKESYKLVVYHGMPATARSRSGELYDLETDPQEQTNLWNSPHHAHIRQELESFLLDALVATEDRWQPREAVW